MEKSFRRYRLMSFVTGTTLLILFACLILQHVYPHDVWDHFPRYWYRSRRDLVPDLHGDVF